MRKGPEILLVEDEPKVADFIKRGLEESGFEVEISFDGKIGLRRALSNEHAIIILDINLPYVNGFEICRQVRLQNQKISILMLTALDTIDDKVEGFEAGADDYLRKPFEFKELLARVRALMKRSEKSGLPERMLRISDLEIDRDSKIVKRGGKKIELTAREFALLEYMILNKNRVLSRMDIAEKIWDLNFDTGTNVIDVYVNFLRKKIDKDFDEKLIHTQIGMGYILRLPE